MANNRYTILPANQPRGLGKPTLKTEDLFAHSKMGEQPAQTALLSYYLWLAVVKFGIVTMETACHLKYIHEFGRING